MRVRGLEEAETAIKFDPNNESAWSYKTNLLLEAAKLAEMDGKADQKAQYEKQAEVAGSAPPRSAEERRKKEEAAEAAAGYAHTLATVTSSTLRLTSASR